MPCSRSRSQFFINRDDLLDALKTFLVAEAVIPEDLPDLRQSPVAKAVHGLLRIDALYGNTDALPLQGLLQELCVSFHLVFLQLRLYNVF